MGVHILIDHLQNIPGFLALLLHARINSFSFLLLSYSFLFCTAGTARTYIRPFMCVQYGVQYCMKLQIQPYAFRLLNKNS